jgi:RNA polymerase sigma-70 factor (ECF subfamily)
VTPSATPSPETLLAHAGWMRALALGLVRDPAAADDVAQDAALAALLHPPPAGVELRPWLAQVVRRFAWRRSRSESRRSEREAWATQPAGPEDAGETLARLDLQRALLDAVRGLEEPVRTTIVQRYFEGRSAAEIAAASGVPASTVRARVARGLELLRARLDRESGSRAAWMALVAPLVPREFAPSGAVTASVLTHGALTMTLAKVSLVAGAALVAGLAWWHFAPQGEPSEPLALAPLEEPLGSELTQEVRESVREEVVDPRSADDSAGPAVAPRPAQVELHPALAPELRGSFEVRFVDDHGAPWIGVDLRTSMPIGDGDLELARGASDVEGRARVEVALPNWARANVDRPGGAAAAIDLVARRPGCATRHLEVVVRAGDVTNLGDVVLVGAGTLRGRVVDEHGRVVGDARVGVLEAAALEALDEGERERFARKGSHLLDELLTRVVRADGSFEFDDVAPGRVRVWAHAPGRRYALGDAVDVSADGTVPELELVLPALAAGDRIAGRVVGPDGLGRPASLEVIARKATTLSMEWTQTDLEGRFDFTLDFLDAVYDLTAMDGLDELGPASATGVRPGDLGIEIVLGSADPLRVHVVDEAGAAVSGAEIRISTRTLSYEAKARELAPGEYGLDRPGKEFAIEVVAAGFRQEHSRRFEPHAAPARIDLVLRRAPAVRGVVTAGGVPQPNAPVTAFEYDPLGSMTVNGLRCRVSAFDCGATRSDAHGRFELFVDTDAPIVVRASAEGWVDAESEPVEPARLRADDVLELALGRGGSIEGRVLVPAGESAAGRIVGAHRGDGRPISTRTAEDGTFRFERLMPGDWYVLPLQAEVTPHGGTYSSTSSTEPMPWSCRVVEGRATRFDLTLE